MTGAAAREGRHTPGPEAWWGESWYLDFVSPDGAVAGYCRLGLYPGQDAAWYWFHVARPDGTTVQIRDHTLPCPTGSDLRVEGDGWRSALEPTDDGWSVEVDGTARALDHPLEAYGAERGGDVDLTAALRWHGRGPVFEYEVTTRYEQTCRVEGSLSIDGRDWDVAATGQRDHSWAVRDWLQPHLWSSGTLEDGWAYHLVWLPHLDFTIGYLLSPDDVLEASQSATIEPAVDDDALAAATTFDIAAGGQRLRLTATPVAHAAVRLPTPGEADSLFPRAAVALRTQDGRSGWGWIEYNLPGGDFSAFRRRSGR
jgi:hypothetical protein